jgi:hypothetical protein
MSTVDLLTDIYVTHSFWKERKTGKMGYFKASLASLLLSIFGQLGLTYLQNKKLGAKRIARECFPILIGVKPALDAFRVASGAKQEVGAVYDPMMEMVMMKGMEMLLEAIPGVIIQLMAIASTGKGELVSRAAWLSLIVSALTTGFTSSTISYDFDIDPANRETRPDFYGYIPAKASKRTILFVSMILITAGMLVIRCMTMVLLGLIQDKWAVSYILIDVSIYMVVKVLRHDFWYWMPLGGGTAEFVNSFFARINVKIMTDFTSGIQFRHPGEVGGAYWLFGFALTMVSLPIAISVIGGNGNVTNTAANMTDTRANLIDTRANVTDTRALGLAQTVVSHIIPFTLLSFAMFFCNIEKGYLGTFYSTKRGKDMTMSLFLDGKNDEVKFEVIGNSRKQWVSIEDEVRKWVKLNWAKWEEEKPDWFTDTRKAFVPVEFIPTTDGARAREGMRRESVEGAEGSLRKRDVLRASIRSSFIGNVNGSNLARVQPVDNQAN